MNQELFENTVLAILKAAPGLGSIQIRKALCIADAVHNSLHGKGITGVRYIKEKLGPVPDNEGFRCLVEMELAEKIEVYEETSGLYTKNSYFAVSEPNYAVFSRSQIDIIHYGARIASTHTGSDLSFKTHDAVYDSIGMREEIPLAAMCTPIVTGYNTEPFTEEEQNDVRRFFESDEASVLAFS
jgi:hypothetical protein